MSTHKPLLIGSRALDQWKDPDNRVSRVESDWDIITDDLAWKAIPGVEVHGVDLLNNRAVLDLYTTGREITFHGRQIAVCSLEGLAMIKRSHLHRPRRWERHMWMYQQIPSVVTAHVRRQVGKGGFLDERIKLTKAAYGDRVPKLNMSNEKFFDDNVKKYFVHDDLHALMAHYDEPLYERMKVDKEQAKCERSLWDKFSHEDKVKCVLEECYVIGLERFIIPKKIHGHDHMPAHFAATKALQKVCTTLCSGWFRDFAIDHYSEILESIDRAHMETFFDSYLWRESLC